MARKEDNSFEQNLLNNLFELWIGPEIDARQSRNELPKPARISAAQIIFKLGKKPTVRLNSEVQGIATVKLNDPVSEPINKGDPVEWSQVSEIQRFELVEQERDFGHATVVNIRGAWSISFDFIYNKTLSRTHIHVAKEFLSASKLALESGLLRPLVDNLHSASELAAKAYLLSRPDKTIMTAKKHGPISAKINAEGKLGNVEPKLVRAFNRLQQMRRSARYLQGSLGLDDQKARDLLVDIEAFISQVEDRLGFASVAT